MTPLLKEAQSWSEVHWKLDELGLQFREARKGLMIIDAHSFMPRPVLAARIAHERLLSKDGVVPAKGDKSAVVAPV